MSNLPYDSEVEYIESTGTQYIDTGFKPNQDTRAILDMSLIGVRGGSTIWGCRTSNSDKQFYFMPVVNGTKSRWSYGNKSNETESSLSDGHYTFDANKSTLNVFGTVTKTYTNTTSSFTCEYTFTIFGLNTSGGTKIVDGIIRLYGCQLYDNGTLVRDYIPVRVGQTGYLYDKVTKQLFGNAGTGDFVIGPDKVVIEEGGHVPMLGRRGLMNKKNSLDDYIQFEDSVVESICVNNWSSDGIGLTYRNAKNVSNIGTAFKNNTAIVSFNEFRYFTKIKKLNSSNNFSGCTALKYIKLPESITDFEYGDAFSNCSSLEEISLHEGITQIGTTAFKGCSKLKVIEFPSTVTTLGNWFCMSCSCKLIFNSLTPPTGLSSSESNNRSFGNGNIYVPDDLVDLYKSTYTKVAGKIYPKSDYIA